MTLVLLLFIWKWRCWFFILVHLSWAHAIFLNGNCSHFRDLIFILSIAICRRFCSWGLINFKWIISSFFLRLFVCTRSFLKFYIFIDSLRKVVQQLFHGTFNFWLVFFLDLNVVHLLYKINDQFGIQIFGIIHNMVWLDLIFQLALQDWIDIELMRFWVIFVSTLFEVVGNGFNSLFICTLLCSLK